jgi:hypothetical protein
MGLARRFAAPNGTIILLAIAVGVLTLPVAIHAQTTELDRFVGRDLFKTPPTKKDLLRLNRFVGEVSKGWAMQPAPWHVWKINGDGQTRYVVLLCEPEMVIPGGSSACIQLFDATAKRINSWSFQTGWRGTPDSASIEFSSDLASHIIVLHMARFINGRNIAKEYFSMGKDRLQFVRLENDKGEAVQNDYLNFEIGVVPDAATADQWADMLESKDTADVLSALMFLGGRHIVEPRRDFLPLTKESKYAELFEQLVGTPRIRELIERLTNSNNEWVKQAALLAARGPRERLFQ